MPTLERHDDVFLLDLGATENRFHPDWLTEVNAHLDEAVGSAGSRALVTTASGKFWSNGLDLGWLGDNSEQFRPYVERVHALLSRMLTLPMVTVAAVQGHAFAAGAMLTLCHDLRIMRADRGYWCLPEVDIDIPFSAGMSALIRARLTPQTAHEAMVLGRRFGGEEAYGRGIVDRAVSEPELRDAALELAAAHTGKTGSTIEAIKLRMYAGAVDALAEKL